MGKGGVGKTTLSVELAHACQEAGKKVCIVGLDQQHNAADVLRSRKYEIPYFGLYAWDRMSAMVQYIVDNTFMKQFKEYVPLVAPDFITLCALSELLVDHAGEYDAIVIDFPPNHAGLSMLNAPDLLSTWAWKAYTVKGRVKRLLGKTDAVLDNAEYLWNTVKAFKAAIKGARMWAVTLPAELSVAESLKLVEFLRKNEYNVAGFVLNRFPGDTCECYPCRKAREEAVDWYVYLQQRARAFQVPVVVVGDGRFSDVEKLV